MADHRQLVEVRNWIVDNLDREQTSLLSADLGVDYDGLEGGSEGAKALHLIGYLQRRGRIDELFQAVDRIRADPSLLGASSSGLPTRCPSCNAPLLPDEIEWFNPSLARCAYCGTPVRAQDS